jgi:hypothetical protein
VDPVFQTKMLDMLKQTGRYVIYSNFTWVWLVQMCVHLKVIYFFLRLLIRTLICITWSILLR